MFVAGVGAHLFLSFFMLGRKAANLIYLLFYSYILSLKFFISFP